MVTGHVSCTRVLEWDAMHRLPGHEGKCRAFHGHRYRAEITCTGDAVDHVGRIIDFGAIKRLVGAWIDRHWDHTAILARNDDSRAAQEIIRTNTECGTPVYLLDAPPSAENLAVELARVAAELLNREGVRVARVKIWETPNCYATWQTT